MKKFLKIGKGTKQRENVDRLLKKLAWEEHFKVTKNKKEVFYKNSYGGRDMFIEVDANRAP